MDLPNFARHLILQFIQCFLFQLFIDLIFILYYHILKYGIGYYWRSFAQLAGQFILINILFFQYG